MKLCKKSLTSLISGVFLFVSEVSVKLAPLLSMKSITEILSDTVQGSYKVYHNTYRHVSFNREIVTGIIAFGKCFFVRLLYSIMPLVKRCT